MGAVKQLEVKSAVENASFQIAVPAGGTHLGPSSVLGNRGSLNLRQRIKRQ